MPQIYFSEEELLTLNEVARHIDDHERWMFDVMDGKSLKNVIDKVTEKTNPIINELNKHNTSSRKNKMY
ncbi:hypothetical protein [Halocella sp. SP3-1]|uniref:hypothetical protein n=1 Tax=Halocella sp. SP3-1 TaxID=2382161 RepID=UPI000F75E745|nr:hypothetical protein [Halocella sp. SP3-1]AZO95243.1 hypothetical protein D7D81_11950 [Halocella sp. SP3-1]